MARKRDKRKGAPIKVEVIPFRSSGSYPYFKTMIGMIFAFSFFFFLAIMSVVGIIEILLMVAVIGVIILVFGLSPALTEHMLGGSSLVIRHGWYFTCRIQLDNVSDVEETDEGIPGHGVNFLLGGNRMYITNSRVGLVKIMLHDRKRMGLGRLVSEIVINVDDPGYFIKVMRERAGLTPLPERKGDMCPECGRPLEKVDRAPSTDAVVPGAHMIECIFLVHHDGRLIASYKSGRVQTKETFSVTGMLTVIQDFVGDAFKRTEGGLKTLEHGDLKVLIERGANVYLAVVVEGSEPPQIRKEMRRALKEVELHYGEILDEKWDGELTHLKDLKKILAQVLWT